MAEDDSGDREQSDGEFDPSDLTEKQRHVISQLPASSPEIGDALGVTKHTAKTHIRALRKRGLDVEYDADANVYYMPNGEKVRRVSTKHKGQITREANEFATEQEAAILRRLKGKDPLVAPTAHKPGNEDVVLVLGDVHIGDVVENSDGVEVFNPEIAVDSVDHFTEKALALIERIQGLSSVDTVHVVWTGDMITNENIYDGQQFQIGLKLRDQLSEAVAALTRQVATLADHDAVDAVQVVAVPGNHGKTRASGVSKQANMDLILYRWVHDRLIDRGYDDVVRFDTSEAQHFANFPVRGGEFRGHARHGHNAMQHIDATSRSQSDWRGWQNKHSFDFAVMGHHHTSQRAEVMNEYPVIMSPSMKPGDDFAEKIGRPDVSTVRKLGTVFGVSDQRAVTWEFVLDDADMPTPVPNPDRVTA